MDIREELDREHNKLQCSRIADYIGKNGRRFEQLVQIFVEGPYRVTQRAAWPLSLCVERQPELAVPHLKTLIGLAGREKVHDSVKRNVIRLLQYTDIPRSLEGKVLQLAFGFLQNRREAIAVRVFSMTVIEKLAQGRPELLNELKVIIEDEMPLASGAFRSRGAKILAGKVTAPAAAKKNSVRKK